MTKTMKQRIEAGEFPALKELREKHGITTWATEYLEDPNQPEVHRPDPLKEKDNEQQLQQENQADTQPTVGSPKEKL